MSLGGLGLYRRIKDIFGRKVDLEKFWLKKGKIYTRGERYRRPLIEVPEYLKKISFNSVLEFGCGAGKLTKLILDKFNVDNYTAFDLSPDQINNAKLKCQEHHQIDFQISSIQKFTTNKKFDLVIGSNVLEHIPPMNIKDIIQHLSSFTKKHFIHIDAEYSNSIWRHYNDRFIKTRHAFRHDYRQIYKELDSIIDSLNTHSLPTINNNVTTIFHITTKQSNPNVGNKSW